MNIRPKCLSFFYLLISNEFFLFENFQVNGDRFYLDGRIKICRSDAIILRNMNVNVLQRCREHDYSFVCRLIQNVFSEEALRNSTSSDRNWTKTAYARLDDAKYNFVEDVFRERVENNRDRLGMLPKFINMRCAALRNRKKRMNH